MPYRGGGVPQRRVYYDDTANLDAFGRVRASEPETLFESQMQYNGAPLLWETALTGSGSATHLPNESALRMRTTTASGDKTIRQTKQYIRYQPGKSQLILVTFVLGARAANVRKRVGYFETSNGLFLEQTGDGLFLVRRSYTTGAVVDMRIPQSEWNIDPLNGAGVSGITLNETKAQILGIDIEWLGVGRVRIGFVINGTLYYAHQFSHANVLSTTYMTTANLPVRYEIENTGTAASATNDLLQICASVSSEGGRQERAPMFSVANGVTLRTVSTTLLPLLSIRVGTVFPAGGSIVNRATMIPLTMALYSKDSPVFYQVILNGTLTGASFAGFNTTHSGALFDVAASAIANGIVLDAGYASSSATNRMTIINPLESNIALTQNIAGNAGDILTVAAIRVGTTDSDCGAVITWKELY